ncbi:hypothetical protein GHT06_017698 [Daphnia sinensis]|uniref:Uncharacterized protein n=1 Tax=Daphnia sinensis TaxID=1820382 RepID=A0AAD5LCL4_9CRUS|nr:hypothetical protein GHT06_017698 [Daphnia sinensis]
MEKLSRNLLCVLLAASMIAACSAAAAADPALDSKPALQNSADHSEKIKSRESHALKSEASYANYLKSPAAPAAPSPVPATLPPPVAGVSFPSRASPAVHPSSHPIPVPALYSNPHETTMGYVYYYLPQVAEKYYPKLKDLMPYVKNYGHSLSRFWKNMPSMRHMADRTFDITSAVGLVLLAPVMLISSILFLGFIVILFLFPAVSAFGRRRMGRDLSGVEDLNEVFDFDRFLPAEQSRRLASLAARVDNVLDNYMRALKSDTCLEKFSCQAGHMTSRLGKFTEPIITSPFEMAKSVRECVLFVFLATSVITSYLASAVADPVLNSKPPSINPVEPVKRLRGREGQALRSEVSYANYFPAPTHRYPTPAFMSSGISYPPFDQPSTYGNFYPAPAAPVLYQNPHQIPVSPQFENSAHVPEKYYPTFNDLAPYLKSPGYIASRVWQKIPPVRQIADRTIKAISSVVGLTVIVPAIILTAVLFVIFLAILSLFPAVSAFGRRDFGRDWSALNELNDIVHFDRFLPLQQSRALASLAARVDSVLDTYMDGFKNDACLERYSCEAGKMTSRLGKFTEPVISFLEPLVPSYLFRKLEAFKNGARSGPMAECRELRCSLPFFG